MKAPHLFALDGELLPRQHDVNLRFDDLVRTHIGHPKHQAGQAVALGDARQPE